MLRSDFVMKLMSVVLLIAIAVYIGLYVFNVAGNPLKTTMAKRFTVEESCSAEGYIVRNEKLLTGDGKSVTLLAAEGEKIASGQAIAVSYEDKEALERASEIRALSLQIEANETGAEASLDPQSSKPDECILALSDAVQHKNFENLEEQTLTIKKEIFTGSSEKISSESLASLKDKLADLVAQNTDAKTITSPMSGIFSSDIDGFEAIGPDSIKNLTPSALQALFTSNGNTEKPALGKLLTGITWYYAAVMDIKDAQKLKINDQADMQFTKTYNANITMKVENIGAEENGKCVVIFSSKQNMSEMTALRSLSSEIVFKSRTRTGLLVPKEAVHQENGGKPYIYLLTGLQAERVYVELMCEQGDCYLVKDGTVSETVLREGSEIIVKAKDLYDKKVVLR